MILQAECSFVTLIVHPHPLIAMGMYRRRLRKPGVSRNRKTVSQEFRKLVRKCLPGLDKNPAYWGLFELCLTLRSAAEDAEDIYQGIYVGADLLARLEGKEHLLKHKNYSGVTFLKDYKRDVAPIVWTEHNYKEHMARRIIHRGIPDQLLIAYQQELQIPAHKLEHRVWLRNGLVFSPKTQHQVRVEDQQAALERLEEAGCDEAKQFMAYLDTLPPARFTKMLSYMPEAYGEAAKANPYTRDRQFEILRAIEDQCQPFYAPSAQGRSVRLFSTNDSLTRLSRKIRKILCRDWITLDLKAAQFAICARLWNVPIAQEFLQEGQSLWRYLFMALDVMPTEEHKAGLKKMLYALIFGAGRAKNQAIEQARKNYLPDYPDLTARFFDNPLIDAFYKARRDQQKVVERNGGAYDAFENFIPLKCDEHDRPSPRSVLACQAQSYELRLLWPIIQWAWESKDFDIMLYLFDGICIAPRDKHRVKPLIKRLQDKVKETAESLGIVTSLECDESCDFSG